MVGPYKAVAMGLRTHMPKIAVFTHGNYEINLSLLPRVKMQPQILGRGWEIFSGESSGAG